MCVKGGRGGVCVPVRVCACVSECVDVCMCGCVGVRMYVYV